MITEYACPACGYRFDAATVPAVGMYACPACQKSIKVAHFPTRTRPTLTEQLGEDVNDPENQPGGFYQPQKIATAICDSCGVYVAPLHTIKIGDKTICPKCIQREQADPQNGRLVREHVRYDHVALMLTLGALLPPLLFFMFITAPMALYLVIRHFNKPAPVIQHSNRNFIIAGLLATLQIGLIVASIILIIGQL